MDTVILSLPKVLQQQLESWARSEGVSLNQYLLNALTAHAASGYRVRMTSPQERLEQEGAFRAALDRLGRASEEEINKVLAEREPIEMEPDVDPAIVSKLQAMIETQMKLRQGGWSPTQVWPLTKTRNQIFTKS